MRKILYCTSPALAGEVGERSETGEGGARGTTLSRVARPRRSWSEPRRPKTLTSPDVHSRRTSVRRPARQHRPDRVHDLIGRGINLIVPKLHHLPPLCLQPSRAPRVIRGACLRMLAAVEFDDQLMPHTGKIHDERPDWMLPAKLARFQPSPAQQEPQPMFDLGHIASQRPSVSVCHGRSLRKMGKQTIATGTPLPLFAGEVGKRSETGEGAARATTLTRVAARLDLSRQRGRGKGRNGGQP